MTPLIALGLAVSIGGLAATYVLFPLALVLFGAARGARRAPRGDPSWEPTVSFVITAHDEENAIRAKLENTLALDWPDDRLEVLVASDASTDGTDEIVSSFGDPRVYLVASGERVGKTAATQRAVREAKGEVLVFSDATGVYNPAALRELVAPLADPAVGAVSGRVVFRFGDTQTSHGFRLYQSWIVPQRRVEPVSVSGSIHSMRPEAFEDVPAQLSYDMVVPALCAMHGLRVVFADGAVSVESSRLGWRAEFAARIRIAGRAYRFLEWLRAERHRIRSRGYLVQLFFHKVLRWFSPHLLVLLFASHALWAFGGGWPALALIPHAGLWGVAALLARLETTLRFPGSSALLLFATVNAGTLVGFARWLRGADFAAWNPDRDAEQTLASRNGGDASA
jgi:glycosyltransferase involved in cell wall biosynthesis